MHLTSDDLDELSKLALLIKGQKISLYYPEQTSIEYLRNRDARISDGLNKFKEEKLNNQFPQMCKAYPEYEQLKDIIKQYEKLKSNLHEKLFNDIKTKSLKADKVINDLFNLAKFQPSESKILESAKLRFDIGNPPGKNKSYGDAINWESLIYSVPNNTDLYFVSDDKDYYSEIDKDDFNSFLFDEWKHINGGIIKYHKKLSDFFKENFPDIKLSDELEKEMLINALNSSRTFYEARKNLRLLVNFPPDSFSTQQINDIALASITNNQIYWIGSDSDINKYLSSLILPNEERIEPKIFEQFWDIYCEPEGL